MPILHLVIVAIIQGITEFLPISSSAHLILLPNLSGLDDQGQIIDVAVHFGTLFAVISYFWQDSKAAICGGLDLLQGKLKTKESFLVQCLILATIPAILAGLGLKISGLDIAMRSSVGLIGVTMFGFGLLLWAADKRQAPNSVDDLAPWSFKTAIILGLWQAVALIPGTSRSGITITGARFLGHSRHDAAKMSMLMSIPVIIAATVLELVDVARHINTSALRDGAIAALFAAISAYFALAIMMRLLNSVSFTPYVIYRVIFGLGLMIWAWT